MPKKDAPPQLSLPDIEQMALFEASLPDTTPKRGLEDILRDGDSTELGLFMKTTPYKALRIELTHCGYDLSDVKDKSDIYKTLWGELNKAVKRS